MPGTDNRATLLLKILLWFVSVSHLGLGAAIMVSSELQRKVASIYGAQVDWTPQFAYILRPLGAFMVALGLAGIAAALNPVRYRFVIFCFSILLLIRVAQRLLFRNEIAEVFAIDATRNLANAGFFFALAVALLALGATAGRKKHS
ncbi:MAG: hypothetical protein CMJ18_18680 [Phycisphaeraceae bacterium]|nr:hypothetical protein [Phycisphaeraceae bacterium]